MNITSSSSPFQKSVLREQFLSSSDLHQLYESIKSRTDAEALFIRASILDFCKGWTATHSGPTLDERKSKFASQLTGDFRVLRRDLYLARMQKSPQALCTGFKSDISEKEVDAAYDHAAEAGNTHAKVSNLHRSLVDGATTITVPLVDGPPLAGKSMDQLIPKGPTPAEIALLKEALASRDPVQIRNAGPLLTAAYSDFEIRLQDGKGIKGVPDKFIWDSVACHFAGGCDQQSTIVQRDCILHARCDANSYDELLQRYVLNPEAYGRLVGYRAQLIQAIESGNWALLGEARGTPTNFQRNQILPKPRSPRFDLRF